MIDNGHNGTNRASHYLLTSKWNTGSGFVVVDSLFIVAPIVCIFVLV